MIILGWNRDYEDETWPDYSTDRDWIIKEQGSITTTWTVGHHVNIEVDEPCFLYAQGEKHPKGLLAFGRVDSPPEEGPHYDPTEAAKGKTTNWIRWEVFCMLPKSNPIPRDLLEDRVPGVKWRHIYSSGYFVPDEAQDDLIDLWCEYFPELLEGSD